MIITNLGLFTEAMIATRALPRDLSLIDFWFMTIGQIDATIYKGFTHEASGGLKYPFTFFP
jgi:hypothetical protein